MNLPEYYFRTRENGAVVFRIDTENQFQRIEMEQIAVVNIRNGEVKPHGDHALSEADTKAIDDWMSERRDTLGDREIDDILRTVDHLNHTAAWAQQKASSQDLEQVSDALLMAMHDLRTVLIKKRRD